MNLFEMAQIPLNKAIEVMKLDPNAAAIIACPERTLEVSIPVKWMTALPKYLPATAASTAQLWVRPKAASVIIRALIWTK